MAARGKPKISRDQRIWATLLEMIQETRATRDDGFFCPQNTPCRGGDIGDFCKACWLKAALKRLSV